MTQILSSTLKTKLEQGGGGGQHVQNQGAWRTLYWFVILNNRINQTKYLDNQEQG